MADFINVKFVASWGSIEQCCRLVSGKRCERLTEKMTFVNGHHRCTECAEYYNDDQKKSHITKNNDAKFKCPEDNCDGRLSFREHLVRRCCIVALKNSNTGLTSGELACRDEFKQLKALMDKHEINEKEEKIAKKKMDEAKRAFEDAIAEHTEKHGAREMTQKQLSKLFAEASYSMQEKNGDKQEDSRFFCNVCFEKYDGDDRLQCVLHCGHPSCHKCLTTLPEKLCPICRKPFENENIIKLFYN